MKPGTNLNILPWYLSPSNQNHRKSYAAFGIYPLLALNNILPPFQIVTTTLTEVGGHVITATLHEVDGTQVVGVTLSTAVFRTVYDAYGVTVINDGLDPITMSTLIGRYYIKLHVIVVDSIGAQTVYDLFSEVITFVDDVSNCLKLEYYDNYSFIHSNGEIKYDGTFKNYVYLCTQVGKPEYPFEETATKRDGYTFIEKQVSAKLFKFVFVAPEYLCDALRVVRAHDNIIITNINGDEYSADTFMLNTNWQSDGDLATCEVEFESDTVIKKIAKQVSEEPNVLGDYNSDFNIDFDV